MVKMGFTEVYNIFLISAPNIDCGYSLEPPRRGGSNEYPQSMFWVEIWKFQNFLSEKFHFLVVKFSVYLNTRVFVMAARVLDHLALGSPEAAISEDSNQIPRLRRLFWDFVGLTSLIVGFFVRSLSYAVNTYEKRIADEHPNMYHICLSRTIAATYILNIRQAPVSSDWTFIIILFDNSLK